MARPLSRDLRQRVVTAVLEGSLSNNKAAARFGIAVSTANLWVRKFKTTGSLDHGKIGGHKPATLLSLHRDWLLDRCQGGESSGAATKAGSTRRAWCSSTKPGPRRTCRPCEGGPRRVSACWAGPRTGTGTR